MVDSSCPCIHTQAERRADIRRRAAQAAHQLIEALAAEDDDALVELIGEADVELTRARNETLRGKL